MAAPSAKTLQCRACGAPMELRAGPRARVIVCAYCDTAMDLTDPQLNILWRYEQKLKFQPVVPLGARGTLLGEKLECIGYMRRSTVVEGERYGWAEYLLYNPYLGYRWLVEDEGQWSVVRETMALPTDPGGDLISSEPPRGNIRHMGREFKHFQSSQASVDYCIGEFYWAITVGQQTSNSDYISPPYILSAEISTYEITWSAGQHVEAAQVWEAFGIAGAPVQPTTVGANQPNPVGTVQGLWAAYFTYCLLAFFITMGFSMMSHPTMVFHHDFAYPANVKERSFVTDFFTIPGRWPADLEVRASTSLDNRWVFYRITLINDETNEAIDFGIENSNYHGVEDGEAWTEGTPNTTEVLSHVAPGKYYFRIEPESGTSDTAQQFRPDQPTPGPNLFTYTIEAKSDVVLWSLFWYAVLLMLPIPIIQSIRRWAFESRRWSKSG